MTRIILVSGKGGVGKTTLAAATALEIAKSGRKTLILSFDLAHSLRDSFGLGGFVELAPEEDAYALTPFLDIKELDVSKEIAKEWGPVYGHLAKLMSRGGLDSALSQELAMLPGMEDISALLALHKYVRLGRYETVVLDCPPTASTLRFIGMASGMKWYVDNRLKRERALAQVLRPLARMIDRDSFHLPGDDFFATFAEIVQSLTALEERLQDPDVTSLRLVCNPERIVMRETQRAFMYFSMYGVAVDQVVINRVFVDDEPYFRAHAQNQQDLIASVSASFEGVPCVQVPFLEGEVVGLAALERFAAAVYGGQDPAAILHRRTPVTYTVEGEEFVMTMSLPFAEREQLDVSRQGEDLLIRVGTFKRRVTLPTAFATFAENVASLEDGVLRVRFCTPASNREEAVADG